MDFINAIKKADIAVFRFINVTLHSDLLAAAVRFTANDVFLVVAVFAGLFFLVKSWDRKSKQNTAFALWAVIAANIISSDILKPVFKRPRPVVVLHDIYFLVTMRRPGWAFPSTHTAVAAALATVLWDDYKQARWLLAAFVFFVGFFCVYSGGHYPSDVAAGFVVGVITGSIFNFIKKHNRKTETKD